MKTIGLIGGMSWESTQVYYRALNEGVKKRLGGFHSAKVLINSVDFHEIEACQQAGDWDRAAVILADCAESLQKGGADCVLIGANTMHLVYDQVSSAVEIPVIHIGDAAGAYAVSKGHQKLGLLGTKFTMEMDFYKGRMANKYGLEVVIPDPADVKRVHDIIYQELCLGTFKDSSRETYLDVISRLADQGCEAVLLGCTEIGLLMGDAKARVPLADTCLIHAEAALDFAMANPPDLPLSG